MKGLIALVVATILGLAIALATYLGVFKDVQLTTGEFGPFFLVSKRHTGPYHQVMAAITEVEAWARNNGEECKISFGEYFDDPNVVSEDRLQSEGGCIVSKKPEQLPEGLLFREVPRRLYVVAEFEGAPSIGPYKVYPRVQNFIAEERMLSDGPVIEMYEVLPDQKLRTKYYFPTKK